MNICLTFDYELFGDGTGNVFTHVVEPTNKILDICNRHKVRTTIFFEVIEYLKLKEEWDKGNAMGYTSNPIAAIEKQIQAAALGGHDIQLHIHPQWHNAKYENGNWVIDFSNWRLGDFEGVVNYTIKDLIANCKIKLEEILKPVMPEYECIGLRAGGYNIMPSSDVFAAMKSLNIKYDSSVYSGGYETGNLSKYDYRQVSSCLDHWWASANDIRVAINVEKEILEIPIFALPVARWKRLLTYQKIKSLFFGPRIAMSSMTKLKIRKHSFLDKIRFLLQSEASTWDVCMFPKSLHRKFFKHIESVSECKRDSFVLIGHPKNLQDESVFESFFDVVGRRKSCYTFKTLKEKYEEVVV